MNLLPCPFCGSTNIDPKGWASTDRSGPACDDCAGTADTIELWNSRPGLSLKSRIQAEAKAEPAARLRIDRGRYLYKDLSDDEHCRFNVYLEHLGPSLVYATTYTQTDAVAICALLNAHCQGSSAPAWPTREQIISQYNQWVENESYRDRAPYWLADRMLKLFAAITEKPAS